MRVFGIFLFSGFLSVGTVALAADQDGLYFSKNWQELKASVQKQWQLSAAELEKINGDINKLVATLEERGVDSQEKIKKTKNEIAKYLEKIRGETKDSIDGETVADKWSHLKGEVRKRWSQLTDEELANFRGKAEELEQLLREKYGYTVEKAKAEVKKLMEN